MSPIKIVVFLTIVSLLFACEQKREYFIPQDKMVDILVDIHVADGVLNTASFPYDNIQLRPENYYKNVLAKHNITRIEFDSALSLYTQDRELYIKMYDEVIEELRTKESFIQGEDIEDKKGITDGKLFYYSFNTDYETSNGLSKEIQTMLSSKKSRSGKQAIEITKKTFIQRYQNIVSRPVQELEFQVYFNIFFEEKPKKFPTLVFRLEKGDKILAKQEVSVDKFVKSKNTWQKVKVKIKLSLSAVESNVNIDTYIFNKANSSFFIDDYDITIKQTK